MTLEEKIEKLKEYKSRLRFWQEKHDSESREYINQSTIWVQREVIEAGCYSTITIGPPPAIGGLIMRDVDPFSAIFDPPYFMDIVHVVIDMIDKTIGVLMTGPEETDSADPVIEVDSNIEKGYVFVAMPMSPQDQQLEDVLDGIKEAVKKCGLNAERVDDAQSNERITDRILESIRKAEYVIVDLTDSRPNVFYEAGYAQGMNKTPIYIARKGTKIEFDLKDYPVIFFSGIKQLKDELVKRLIGISKDRN
jgi:hypothetical protein